MGHERVDAVAVHLELSWVAGLDRSEHAVHVGLLK
jgi:hypothetical protein